MVFDTNVYISAIITEGLCSKLLKRARKGEFTLISCPCIVDEIKKVLSEKFKASAAEILSAIDVINESVSKMVSHEKVDFSICKDKEDDKIIACAFKAKADYLVTGDTDLLEIRQYKNIKIISPRDFEMLFD
ncbi:MAG: putative toxin-antitoxin system toxin component, PIN family [Thermodesulfovibrionales bacterium]